MDFDYRKLRGRIIEKYGNQLLFAKAMGISNRTLSLKLSGQREWKQSDICLAIKLLELSDTDTVDYFFKRKVQ